jgi:glycosyltransferase involved in cell wall biosynthesis
VISFIGRYEKYKGLEHLLLAVNDLKERYSQLMVIACGMEGSYLQNLYKLIREKGLEQNTKLVINPENEYVFDMLSASQVFVLPSSWEAFGISILEGMAKGNAIISSHTEGGDFLVNEDENGFLFEHGDHKQISQFLEILLQDKKTLLKMQRTNRVKAGQFVWDEIIKDYLALVNK